MSDEPGPGLFQIRTKHYQRVPDFLELWSRTMFVRTCIGAGIAIALLGLWWWPLWLVLGLPWALLTARGVLDMNQEHHAILKNYPVIGHLRYVLESVRPEIQQYFVEDDHDGRPFDREDRSVVYQRANRRAPLGAHLPGHRAGLSTR